jgi:hypothetical protein
VVASAAVTTSGCVAAGWDATGGIGVGWEAMPGNAERICGAAGTDEVRGGGGGVFIVKAEVAAMLEMGDTEPRACSGDGVLRKVTDTRCLALVAGDTCRSRAPGGPGGERLAPVFVADGAAAGVGSACTGTGSGPALPFRAVPSSRVRIICCTMSSSACEPRVASTSTGATAAS